nr:alkaline phosphatase D family protein [Blastocatellia bacterium]
MRNIQNSTPEHSWKVNASEDGEWLQRHSDARCSHHGSRLPKLLLARCAIIGLLQMMTMSLAWSQVLTHGPVVGGVTASSANVFVRTNQGASVALRFGTDPNLETYLVSETFATSSASDFTKIIPIPDLTAETIYYLDVTVDGVPQLTMPPYPTFKTFPEDGTSRDFKFVVLADFKSLKSLTETTTTFSNAAAAVPDFAFIGGDFDHRNPQTLSDKRTMFKELYDPTTPFMSGFVPLILQKMPIIHQWDDHDAGGNNLDRTYREWNLSQQVFQEYVPAYPLPSVTPGIWQKFSYAQAEGFVLDCRSQRDPVDAQDDSNKSMLDGNNLGPIGELAWLKDALLASTARWKIIFTSVTTNPSTKFPDGWAGYQTEWQALKDFITLNQIQGVVFISGDLHLGAIDDGTAAGFPEMCVAKANYEKADSRCSTAPPGVWSEGYFEDPCSGYGLVSVMQNPDRLILEAVD